MYVHYRIVFILTTILLSLQTSVIIALTQKSTFTFLSYTFTLIWKSLYPLHWWLCWDRQTVPLSPARGQTRSSSRNSQTGLLPCATQKLLWTLKCLKCFLSQDFKTKKGFIKIPAFTGFANKLGQPESEFVPKSQIRPNFRPKDRDYQLHICWLEAPLGFWIF